MVATSALTDLISSIAVLKFSWSLSTLSIIPLSGVIAEAIQFSMRWDRESFALDLHDVEGRLTSICSVPISQAGNPYIELSLLELRAVLSDTFSCTVLADFLPLFFVLVVGMVVVKVKLDKVSNSSVTVRNGSG